MAKKNEKRRENERELNRKRDVKALEAMGHIVVASESIMGALDTLQASGSRLYRQDFKQATTSYRKRCFAKLNECYDVMATGDVSDAFLTEVKGMAGISNMITMLDQTQREELGHFIHGMLNPTEEEKKEKDIEVKSDLGRVMTNQEVSALYPLTPEQAFETKTVEEVEVEKKAAEEYYSEEETIDMDELIEINKQMEIDAEIAKAIEEAKNSSNPLEDLLNREKIVEVAPIEDVLPNDLIIMVDMMEFNRVVEGHATDGVLEGDLMKKTLNSICTVNSIDTDVYAFSRADEDTEKITLTFKLK